MLTSFCLLFEGGAHHQRLPGISFWVCYGCSSNMADEMRSSEILLLVIVLQPIEQQKEISYPKSGDIVANNVVGRLFFIIARRMRYHTSSHLVPSTFHDSWREIRGRRKRTFLFSCLLLPLEGEGSSSPLPAPAGFCSSKLHADESRNFISTSSSSQIALKEILYPKYTIAPPH